MERAMCELPTREFLDALASASPTPGGGGASAHMGALAAALSAMVAHLTLGKKRYEQVQDQIEQLLQDLDHERALLLQFIDDDARVFEPLAAAYRMPSASPEEQAAKEAAMQVALIGATEVPLAIMRHCARVIDCADTAAHIGSRLALSDAGVSAVCAKAALLGASLNVRINVASMNDPSQAQSYVEDMEALIADYTRKADATFDFVVKELSA